MRNTRGRPQPSQAPNSLVSSWPSISRLVRRVSIRLLPHRQSTLLLWYSASQ